MRDTVFLAIIISATVAMLAYRTATTGTFSYYKSVIPSDKKYNIPQQHRQGTQEDIYALTNVHN